VSGYRHKILPFGIGTRPDADYLTLWRGAPLTYTPGQPTDSSWHTDHHAEVLTERANAERFARARDLLLRYEFYPPSVMRHVSDFSQGNRLMRPGDRIVQRIYGPRLLGVPLVAGLTMNEVTAVIDEPRRVGFIYITTQAHAETGEWSALVEWRADDSLVLTVSAVSRLAPHMPGRMADSARRLQLHAHHLGMEAFRKRVLSG
jgi:uncharacterized protein (UPF0548 family)